MISQDLIDKLRIQALQFLTDSCEVLSSTSVVTEEAPTGSDGRGGVAQVGDDEDPREDEDVESIATYPCRFQLVPPQSGQAEISAGTGMVGHAVQTVILPWNAVVTEKDRLKVTLESDGSSSIWNVLNVNKNTNQTTLEVAVIKADVQ